MIHIVILNWNGCDDTLACIDSLQQCPEEFRATIVDNGSSDDSLPRISAHITDLPRFALLEAGENLGFARGNNYALRNIQSKVSNDDYILLLNNDTLVTPDFLTRLLHFSQQHPQYQVLTPLICFNHDRNLVWNCGGWQHWGFRRYYYANRPVADIREKGHIEVTFLTGCALLAKAGMRKADGTLLTEDFFFGEEDFEFCMRMNAAGHKMACVLDSCIYHKVSSSVKGKNQKGKLYVHNLNRIVDVQNYFSPLSFRLWQLVYAPCILRQAWMTGFSLSESLHLLVRLYRNARGRKGVSRTDFLQAIGDAQ